MGPRRLLASLLAPLLALFLASCGGDTAASTAVVEPSVVASAIADGATVIDVRTPAEFAGGHLAGALNLDVSSADFESKVDTLDKSQTYVVYCHSGNRSTDAAETMVDLGFDDVVNGGGIADLVESGLELG